MTTPTGKVAVIEFTQGKLRFKASVPKSEVGRVLSLAEKLAGRLPYGDGEELFDHRIAYLRNYCSLTLCEDKRFQALVKRFGDEPPIIKSYLTSIKVVIEERKGKVHRRLEPDEKEWNDNLRDLERSIKTKGIEGVAVHIGAKLPAKDRERLIELVTQRLPIVDTVTVSSDHETNNVLLEVLLFGPVVK